jgi:hypothetical protein
MLEGFRYSGGLIAGGALAAMLRPHCDQPISSLARPADVIDRDPAAVMDAARSTGSW